MKNRVIRKLISVMIAAAILFALLPTGMTSYAKSIKGDPDGDGSVTVADALAALRVAAKLSPETPETISSCDVDGDGSVTVADALAILRVAAKLAPPESLGYVDEPFEIDLCIASEPWTLDPGMVDGVDGVIYVQHQFEGLMKYQLTDAPVASDANMLGTEVVPGQATSYTISEDLCVYTFTLRDDIYWSDGQPVTANDFVYSWQRLVDPATGSGYGYFLDGIVENADDIQNEEKDKSELGVRAVDDKTFEVTLEAPCAYFLEMCAFASLVPLREDVVEGNENWTDPANIVVNGAYKITGWEHDSCIRMEPNSYYYDVENLGPDAIVWWLSEDEDEILSDYQAGEYDFIGFGLSEDCFANPYIGTYYLYLNCSVITDWRVRAAMVLSVDRGNIVDNVIGGGQAPATGLVASGILDSTGADFAYGSSELGAICGPLQKEYPGYDLSTYAGRCVLAKKLYDEAVAEGKWDPDAAVVYNFNNGAHGAIAEACASDWQTVLGMTVTLEGMSWPDFNACLNERSFGVARLGWIADYNDATTFLELFVTGNSYNHSLYSDAAFDGAVSDAKAMPDGTDRDRLLYGAEETLFSEGGFPVCPIYYYTNCYSMNGITNVGYAPTGYYFFAYAQQK